MSPEAALDARTAPAVLRDIVRKHRVCYEVWPEYLLVHGRKTQVGFALELYGRTAAGGGPEAPDRVACEEIYREMKRIAEWITPTEPRATRHQVEPFDSAWHAAPARDLEPEVALRLSLLHRHGFDQPVDDCERRCLAEMVASLERLGIAKGRYRVGGGGEG